MKRLYIITGAKGHLASTIIRYLRNEDCQIRGLILPGEKGEDDEQVTYYKGDVSEPDTLEKVFADTGRSEVIVIHAAGIISIADKVSPQLYNVNVKGTHNIIKQCILSRVNRLVYVSTVHAIPESGEKATISEAEHFCKEDVTGAYAVTKAEASQAVLDAVENQGLDAVIVHPSGIVGPYDRGTNYVIQLIQMYTSGRLPAGVVGGYDFVDVRDVAKGCLAAAKKGKKGNCYILSNRYFTIGELLDCVRKTAGGSKKVCLPIGLVRAFVPIFDLAARVSHTRPLYTKYALYTISSNSQFSHDKATIELGYHPRDMQRTITDTIDFLNGRKVPLETTAESGV